MNKIKIKVKNQPDLILPKRANPGDAGYDIVATSVNIVGTKGDVRSFEYGSNEVFYKRIDYIEYGTNLFIAPEDSVFTQIYPRSSISKYNLVLANSVPIIDNSYRGELLLRFRYVVQPEDLMPLIYAGTGQIYTKINQEKIYKIGEKIAQLLPNFLVDVEFEKVDNLDVTDRNSGGFGSSGS